MNRDLFILVSIFSSLFFVFLLLIVECKLYGRRSYKTLTRCVIHTFLVFIGTKMAILAYSGEHKSAVIAAFWSISGIIILGEILYFVSMLVWIYYMHRKKSVRYSSHIEAATD